MGTITSLLKGGATSAMNQIKNSVSVDKINSQLSAAGSGLQIPKVDMPESVKNMKLNIDPSILQLPAGIDSYISPLASAAINASGLKLPSEINGVKLPQMPDLSSVSSEVNNALSGLGLDTNKLGIRSVDDILATPDLSALKSVDFTSPVDLNSMPDLTTAMDSVDIDGIQGEINNLTKDIPGMDSIDISKYF